MEPQVAVITGANAQRMDLNQKQTSSLRVLQTNLHKRGVGLSLADRLLTEYRNLHICLACRNEGRAENAQHKLLRRHPGASVSVIIVDVSSVKSVLEAAERIKEKFQKIDFLYLNAGIMKVSSINWSKVLQIFSKDGAKILSTGWGVLNHIDGVTDEGLQEVFATNLFGHFVLVRELQDYLTASGNVKIVWTSSQNANAGDLNYEDVQHRKGREPYSSSKQASDVLSVALNERLNKQGVYSTVTCPGLVFSNLLFGILPSLLWILLLPFLFFMRLFVSNLTCSPYKGAESLVWTSKQRSESLDSRVKYLSNCSVLGKPFIGQEKLRIDSTEADRLYNILEDLYQGFKRRYRDIHPSKSMGTVKATKNIANGYHH